MEIELTFSATDNNLNVDFLTVIPHELLVIILLSTVAPAVAVTLNPPDQLSTQGFKTERLLRDMGHEVYEAK